MANTYDSQAGPADTADTGDEGKVSQEQANYRMGSPQRSCGLCQYFTGSDGTDPYECTRVAGEISPFGFSDEYARQDNPFLAGTQSTFDAGSEAETPAETAAPGEEPDVPGQTVQIGNRTYR